MINPFNHAKTKSDAIKYKVEPYAVVRMSIQTQSTPGRAWRYCPPFLPDPRRVSFHITRFVP